MNTLQQVLRRLATCIVCLLVLLFQCCILDYYLVVHNNLVWCLWVVTDLLVVGLFIIAFTLAFKHFYGGYRSGGTGWGELPLGYAAWGVYTIFLSCKLIIIFGMPECIAQKLDETGFFGVNLLKTTISLSSIVYLLLVATHHDAEPNSSRQAVIQSISSGVAIDILDTVQFLDILFIQEEEVFLTFSEHRTILGISCINLLLPTSLLLILSRSRFGLDANPRLLKLLHMVFYLLLINIPMLVLRLMMWHLRSQDVSVFAIKNVIGIGQTLLAIYELITSICDVQNIGSALNHVANFLIGGDDADQHDEALVTTEL